MPKERAPCQYAGREYSWRAMLDAATIRESLVRTFSDGQIVAEDSTGAGDHFAVAIVSRAFEGKTLVERHQMVYRALASLMPQIHALQLKTVTPGERGAPEEEGRWPKM
jgi:stress-induced morphogen